MDPSSSLSLQNSTAAAGGGELGPSIGITIGIIVVIIVLTIASYLCTRIRAPIEYHASHEAIPSSSLTYTVEQARVPDERSPGDRFLKPGHPKGETPGGRGGSASNSSRSRCSICLRDYKEGHELSSLPECHHLFHTKCIGPWLELNPTCPICRSSPVTTTASTPDLELAPPRGRRLQSNR